MNFMDLMDEYGTEEGVIDAFNRKELNAVEAIWLLSQNTTEWARIKVYKIASIQLEMAAAKAAISKCKYQLQKLQEEKI